MELNKQPIMQQLPGTEGRAEWLPGLLFSLFVHGLIVATMFFSWSAQPELHRIPELPPHVMAVPVQKPEAKREVSKPASQSTPKPKPKPKPKPDPAPQQPVQPETDNGFAQPDLAELLAEEELEMASARKQQQEREKREKAESETLPAAASSTSSKDVPEVLKYVAAIQAKVARKWSRPPSARNGMKTVLKIRLLPGGEVLDVAVQESSGNQALDRSAVNAVELAGVLPVPSGELFNEHFRVFTFVFRPEDLRL